MAMKLPAINGINSSVERNEFFNDNKELNPVFRLFRWTVQTSQTTKDWYSLAKTVRDVFDGACEAARHHNFPWAISWAQSCHGLCAQTTKATIIPYLLGAVDSLVFKRAVTWTEVGKKVLSVTLAVNLVARVTLGIAAFSTPLNYVLLVHYSIDLVTQLHRWNQMRLVRQGFRDYVHKKNEIPAKELKVAIDQERTMQNLRMVDAVASLAAEIFSQMYPAMKLVNAGVGSLTSVYSTGISCYRDMQFEWHFKLS